MVLPALALMWLAGPVCYGVLGLPWWFAGAAGALLLPQAWARAGRGAAIVTVAGVALALCSGWRFDAWAQRPEPGWAAFLGSEVTVEGRVVSEPDPGRVTTAYVVAVDRVLLGDAEIGSGGRLRAGFPQYTDLPRGAAVRFTGDFSDLAADGYASYRDYLRREGISGSIGFASGVEVLGPGSGGFRARVAGLRLTLERALQRVLPEPQASLAAGIGFGRDQSMSPEIEEAFRNSGLAHLIAVSGSNVALLAAVMYFICLRFLNRKWSGITVAMLVAAYAILAGAEWPILRAACMTGVLLAGWFFGRPQVGLAGLAVAVIGLTAWSPGAFASASFQLSVAATAGIILMGDWARDLAHRPRRVPGVRAVYPRRLADALAITAAAQLAVLPLSIALFGQLSLVGLVVNVIAAPLFMAVLPVALVTAIVAALWEPLGVLAGTGAYYPLAALTWLAAWSAGLPAALVTVSPPPLAIVLAAYVMLGAFALALYLRLPSPPGPPPPAHPAAGAIRRVALLGGSAGLLVAIVNVSLLPVRASDTLVVTVLDVGQGDAILVRTPGGQHFLVDGGPSGIALAQELGEVLPHRKRDLSAVFLTHPDLDHVGGLPAGLQRYDAAAVFETGWSSPVTAYTAFTELARSRERLVAGQRFELDGVHIEVLWPPADAPGLGSNESSLVLRLTYGAVTILLTGDIQGEAQTALATADVRADVLKVPHGSRTNAPAFLEAVSPSLAVISAGAGNPYGHPAQETLDSLEGVPLARTDEHGRITIRTDGSRITVVTER